MVAFNRLRIAREGAIQIMVEYIQSDERDIAAKKYCAMALGNLAGEPDNHLEIVKSNGTNWHDTH